MTHLTRRASRRSAKRDGARRKVHSKAFALVRTSYRRPRARGPTALATRAVPRCAKKLACDDIQCCARVAAYCLSSAAAACTVVAAAHTVSLAGGLTTTVGQCRLCTSVSLTLPSPTAESTPLTWRKAQAQVTQAHVARMTHRLNAPRPREPTTATSQPFCAA